MESVKRLICMLVAFLCIGGCSSRQTVLEEQPQEPAKIEIDAVPTDDVPDETAGPELVLPLAEKIICVDPGHEVTSQRVQEPISPHSNATKEAFVGGASGRNQTEEQLNLAVGLRLQVLLEEQGAKVIMTRTTHESDMTSYKRAQMANENHSDLCIRIHADGSSDASVYGMSMLVPYGDHLADLPARGFKQGS